MSCIVDAMCFENTSGTTFPTMIIRGYSNLINYLVSWTVGFVSVRNSPCYHNIRTKFISFEVTLDIVYYNKRERWKYSYFGNFVKFANFSLDLVDLILNKIKFRFQQFKNENNHHTWIELNRVLLWCIH